jgi:phosphate transport system substrate-binding protein
MKRGRLSHLLIAGLCCTIVSCSSGDSITLQGSGATFPAPLYKRWFLEYYKAHPNVRVNYQAIGSGAGIRQFTDGLTALGASDANMSKDEVARFREVRGVEPLLLPMTAGSIVLCYNLPDGPSELKLSRKAYLRIFLGEITTWDDPVIAAANPGVKLPSRDITIVRRSDSSGTTYAFTNHLKAVGDDPRTGQKWTPGVSKSPGWKEGMIGGKGNEGVAALIQQIPGSIGYLELGYAELAELPMALLENRKGAYVKATPQTSEAALKGVKLPPDFRIDIPDPEGPDAYPIVTYTWILCYSEYKDARVADTLRKVLTYCLTEGQATSKELGYIPMPPDIAAEVLKKVQTIGPRLPEKPATPARSASEGRLQRFPSLALRAGVADLSGSSYWLPRE